MHRAPLHPHRLRNAKEVSRSPDVSVTPYCPQQSVKRGFCLRQKTGLVPQAGDQSQPCHYPHNQWGCKAAGQWEHGHWSRHCNKLPEVARGCGRSGLTFSPHLGGKRQFSHSSTGAMKEKEEKREDARGNRYRIGARNGGMMGLKLWRTLKVR